MNPFRTAARLAAAASCALIAACASDSNYRGLGIHPSVNPGPRPIATEPARPDPPSPPPPPGASRPAPELDPRWLVISPLTRIATDSSGTPAIVLHLELRDPSGQAIPESVPGVVRVELAGTAAAEGTLPNPERIWEIDLHAARANPAGPALFDELITRTYAIPLTGLPDWLIAWSQGDPSDPLPSRTPRSQRPELLVWFTLDSPARVLYATRRLAR